MSMKKLVKTALLAVIAAGTLALAIPTPSVNACIKCLLPPCKPCFRYGGPVSCTRCPTCQPIPGCEV
jgi:hypothetical protein